MEISPRRCLILCRLPDLCSRLLLPKALRLRRATATTPNPLWSPIPSPGTSHTRRLPDGLDAGVRDAYRGAHYQPKRYPAFHDTPGYDPAFGPHGPYRDTFRNAFLQGYDRGFYRR